MPDAVGIPDSGGPIPSSDPAGLTRPPFENRPNPMWPRTHEARLPDRDASPRWNADPDDAGTCQIVIS